MLLPLAIAAGVLTPLMATTVLSLGLLASASALGRPRTAAARPTRRTAGLSETVLLNGLSRLHNDLHRALERGELQAWFQPQLRASDRQVVGFEALMRWQHPQQLPAGAGRQLGA